LFSGWADNYPLLDRGDLVNADYQLDHHRQRLLPAHCQFQHISISRPKPRHRPHPMMVLGALGEV
jgi:hypothetical protein